MRILVIGAGAMGSIYGARLSLHNDVTLVDTNRELVEHVRRHGITLEEGGVDTIFHPGITADAASAGAVDLIILFTKALYSRAALDGARPVIGEGTCVMTLQNGAGHERLLSQYVPMERVVIGTTEDNGAVLGPGRVHHGGSGVTNIGLAAGDDVLLLERIRSAFSPCGFDVRIHADIRLLVWDKLMTNVSLSALSAILQCDMSFIAADDHAWSLCTGLVDEALMVAEAQGLHFDRDAVLEKVRTTSLSNPGGYTSIMKDIQNGRRTEVDTISGAVVTAAREHLLHVPRHEMVVALIHALEDRGRS